MMAIFGYEGAGKTIGLSKFYEKNRNVQYIRVRKSMTTKDFYLEVLESQSNSYRGRSKSLYRILNDLRSINLTEEKRLLIIDEAGRFTHDSLGYIHEFRDLTSSSLGIILSGPEEFHAKIMDGVRNRVSGIPEFRRRIGQMLFLERPKLAEITAVCNGYGIFNKNIIKKRFSKAENFSALTDDIELYLEFEGGKETLSLVKKTKS